MAAAACNFFPPASFRTGSVRRRASLGNLSGISQSSRKSSVSSCIQSSSAKKTAAKGAAVGRDNGKDDARNSGELSSRWRELAGSNNWAGLLDPIDPILRAELIRYGEFAQACYDAFDFDRFSRYCGGSKYHRQHFFESVGMRDAGYDVTRYLYATAHIKLPNFFRKSKKDNGWSESANWIGFVAVSNDATTARLGRRDVVVSWRGTVTKLEWLADLSDFHHPVYADGIPCPNRSVKVLAGFLDLYTDKNPACRFSKYSVREQVIAEVRRLVALYTEERGEEVSISMTGHSLGSALATLSAYDLAELGLNKLAQPNGKEDVIPVTVYSFSGPRVGNDHFKERFEGALGLKSLRVVNIHDVVPKVPGILINEKAPELLQRAAGGIPWSYSHVGEKLALDHQKSPFLKKTSDAACFHNLEVHLHLLDGHQGTGRNFELVSGRDLALVNKACDFLKEEFMVPPNWRQDPNRGMILNADGRWVQPERTRIEEHPSDMDHLLNQIGVPRSGTA